MHIRQPTTPHDSNMCIVVRGCQAIPREQILELRVGDIVKRVDEEGDWLWAFCRGKEGWVDPGCVRQLTKDQVKQLATKKSQYQNPFKVSRIHENAVLQKIQREARALKETSQFVESLNWEAADSVCSTAESENRTARPEETDLVARAVESMVAAQTGELAFENRAIKPSSNIEDKGALAALEEAGDIVSPEELVAQSPQPEPSQQDVDAPDRRPVLTEPEPPPVKEAQGIAVPSTRPTVLRTVRA